MAPDRMCNAIIKAKFQARLNAIKVTMHTVSGSNTVTISTENNGVHIEDFPQTVTTTPQTFICTITDDRDIDRLSVSCSEANASINITNITFSMTEPTYENVFQELHVKALNQMLNMYSPTNHTVMNLGWQAANGETTVPSLGGGLALSLLCGVDMGIIPKFTAALYAKNAIVQMLQCETVNNWFCHFAVEGTDAVSWSEYSTIDTAIGIISGLIAARYFGLTEEWDSLITRINELDFDDIMIDGSLGHGYNSDKDPLASKWDYWGGETALLQILYWLRSTDNAILNETRDPPGWNGTGFIVELTALFFNDFAITDREDRWGHNWKDERVSQLSSQAGFLANIYGYSAAEVLKADTNATITIYLIRFVHFFTISIIASNRVEKTV